MPYTLAWDEVFPPDTQPANLLGDDIRDFKRDVRERVASFGAGTLADRPTPEAVFVGVIYYASDEDKLYRWNGASWNLIKDFSTLLSSYLDTTVVSLAGSGDGNTITILGGTLQVGSVVEIQARTFTNALASNGTSSAIYFGAFAPAQITTANTGQASYQDLRATVAVLGASSQRAVGVGMSSFGAGGTAYSIVTQNNPTEVIANPIIVKTATNGAGTPNGWTSDFLFVKVKR